MRFSAEEPESSFFDVPKKRKGKGEKSEKDKKSQRKKPRIPWEKHCCFRSFLVEKRTPETAERFII
jgi:hypothetical protein